MLFLWPVASLWLLATPISGQYGDLDTDPDLDLDQSLLDEIFGGGPGHYPEAYSCLALDNTICSNHGNCVQGRCECESPWTGQVCEVCERCDRSEMCEKYAPCVKCRGFKYPWDQEGRVLNCQELCPEQGDVTYTYAEEESTSVANYQGSAGGLLRPKPTVCFLPLGDHCDAAFSLPDENQTIFLKEMKCENEVTLALAQGSYVGTTTDTGSESCPSPTGFGRLTYDADDAFGRTFYLGEFQCGRRYGRGLLEWADGAGYVGDFDQGRRQGTGRFTHANGDVYEGEFADDLKSGFGSYYWAATGRRYVGWFDAGRRQGEGEMYAPGQEDEPEFLGEYERDERLAGELELPNGDRYEGTFKSGQPHGFGQYEEACGNRYEGQFAEGVKQGNGSYVWANADFYRGQFHNGVIHGHGTYLWNNGAKFEGHFERGRPVPSAGTFTPGYN